MEWKSMNDNLTPGITPHLSTSSSSEGPQGDGIDRRGFLHCMAWVGTGVAWTVSGGVLSSRIIAAQDDRPKQGDFTFVQLSDSHIGFSRPPNKDVKATLKKAIEKINALPSAPAFALHTGDLTHLSKAAEFDDVAELLKGAKVGKLYTVPGEHDVYDKGKLYRERYGKGTRGAGWYSFDFKGVHFIGLVNVAGIGHGDMGVLGKDQLDWLKKDVAGLTDSTPLVVFAHIPLWTVYEKWGWKTSDGAQALGLLKRFGSVSVLNGHIHQVLTKVEGKVTFHSAASTAFPQPAPGKAPSAGPRKDVPAGKLASFLGITRVSYVKGKNALAIVDSTLA
jgi:3',5'-cyclic AMP phosphodiesterase CpdA